MPRHYLRKYGNQQEEELPKLQHLWNHMVQTTNDTQEKLGSLSKKVDLFIRDSELWKESKTKSVNIQQDEKLPEVHQLWDHMAQTTNDTQNKIESLSKKVDHFITASEHWKESKTKSGNFQQEEKLPELHRLWDDMALTVNDTQDKFRALTTKVDHCVKEKHDRAGSNKKINFGILRLLETLILVSTNQFHQMNQEKTRKVHLQLKEKPTENPHLWDHMVQTTNDTQDKLESLSKKVDDFIRASEHRKESKIESVNSQGEEKLPEFHRLWDQMAHTNTDTQDRFMALTKQVDHCIQASERIENTVQRMKDPDPLRYKMVNPVN